GDPDPHHEVADGLALAVLAPDRADAVALRVDPPPAEVRAEPLGRHRVPAFAREAEDVLVGFPRILFTLEPLHSLRLGLFHGFGHCRLRVYPRYRRGTSTHDSHREPSSSPGSLMGCQNTHSRSRLSRTRRLPAGVVPFPSPRKTRRRRTIHGEERLRRDVPAFDEGTGGLLGRGG